MGGTMGMPPPPPSSSSTSETTPSTTTNSTRATNPPAADPLNQLFGQLMSGMSQQQQAGGQMPPIPQANIVPPEQRFQIQLEQLANMGFHDRSANIQGNDCSEKSVS